MEAEIPFWASGGDPLDFGSLFGPSRVIFRLVTMVQLIYRRKYFRNPKFHNVSTKTTVTWLEAELSFLALGYCSRGWPLGRPGPFLGIYSQSTHSKAFNLSSADDTEKNESKISFVAQIKAEIAFWVPRGRPVGPKGPFLGLYNQGRHSTALSMMSACLTDQNEPKMNSLAQLEAEIQFGGPRRWPFGLWVHFWATSP